jgi:hypothetical protein
MAEGAWIFLSHSHKDFDKVSGVRNLLENKGHHPLMFFLKCLSDSDEIDDLIRREIESRSWFVLCDSVNASKSRWVQAEVQIIKGLQTKTYTKINLDDPALDLEAELFSLTHKATVFLSYSRRDSAFAERIRTYLRRHDFGVFSDLELQAGEHWKARTESELENAARRGAVLVLVSAHSVRSEWQLWEVTEAAGALRGTRRAHIVPLFLEGFGTLPDAPPLMRKLMEIQGFDFSSGSFDENMTTLMATLRQFEWEA